MEVVSTTENGQTTTPSTYQEQVLPIKKIATELLSDAINTQTRKIIREFAFAPSGAIQIGNYQDGDTGDIRISPEGIVGRDKFGNTTFSIDGDTGNAIFAGQLQTGTLITGMVLVGDGSIQIDGENVRQVFFDENGVPVIVIGNG